jgi:hypothetical protein
MPRWPATTLGYLSRSNKERSGRYMQVLVPRSLCNDARLLEPELSMRDVAKEAVGLWIEMKRGAMNRTDLAASRSTEGIWFRSPTLKRRVDRGNKAVLKTSIEKPKQEMG